MEHINFPKFVSCDKKTFLILILTIQLSVWIINGLDLIYLQFPLLQQIVGFIYLTFVPGILLLRVLNLRNLNSLEVLIYSVGSSLAILMGIGLFINYFFHLIGLIRPLSFFNILCIISIYTFFMLILAYIRDKGIQEDIKLKIKDLISVSSLFLILIPFLTVLGVYINYNCGNNLLIYLSLIFILIVPILIAFDKMPKKFYPLAIFVISLSLLYHISLVSGFLYGRDALYEFFVSNMALNNLYWDPFLNYEVNSLLSVTILPIIYQEFCKIDLAHIFKILYPVFFAFVPLSLYELFKKQISSKKAFLACFFLISIISFYAEMPQLLRQEIAELFFVLSLLLLFENKIEPLKKSLLLILFLCALTVSHYAMSYIYAFFIISLFGFQIIKRYEIIKNLSNFFKFNNKFSNTNINFSYLALVVVFILAWYIFVSNSITFNKIIGIGDVVLKNIINEFLNVRGSEAVSIAVTSSQRYITLKIVTYLNLLATFFISIGLFYILFKNKRNELGKFFPEYLILSIINFLFWVCAVVVPYFSSILTANRLYHITLLILAPFVVIGGIKFINLFKIGKNKALKLVALCFVVFFIFNVGIVGSIIGEKTSMGLESSSADFPISNELERTSAMWLAEYKNKNLQTFADIYRMPIIGAYDWDKSDDFPKNLNWMRSGYSYVYLGTLNIKTDKGLINGGRFSGGSYINIINIVQNRQRIYDNGKSIIFF